MRRRGRGFAALLLVGVAAAGPGSAEEKVAPGLTEAVTAVQALLAGGASPEELRAASTPRVRVDGLGRLQVYIVLTAVQPDYIAQLQALGAEVELTLPEYRLFQAWVPARSIAPVGKLPFVLEVRPPGYPAPRTE